MEVFEIINNILEDRNMTKREFAQKLISLEPKSNRTGEIISENIVYSYLSGQTSIKSYLIPYISDVLGVPEQFLFVDDKATRRRLIKYLASTITEDEYLFLLDHLHSCFQHSNEIGLLLKYAPPQLLKKLESSLKEIKTITETF